MGTPISMPALPNGSHANARGPCVTSIATHSADTPGIAQGVRMTIPATSANTAMYSPLYRKNKTINAPPATGHTTPTQHSTNTLHIQPLLTHTRTHPLPSPYP